MKNIAVVLSGCGVYDGAEIHESVLTLLALDRAGVCVQCFAPVINQYHVINHLSGHPMSENRSVIIESARISRGNILSLSGFSPAPYDAVVFPGGFGAAKNLCDFALNAEKMNVNPVVEAAILATHAAGKPMGFICIAPALAARVLGSKGVRFTIGTDESAAKALERWGGVHVSCNVFETAIDSKLKVVSTPAYMLAQRITEAESGINRLVSDLLALA